MVLARWEASIVDASGNVLPGATIEVRDEATGLLATLFSDRAGATPLGNPFAADGNGLAAFFVIGGAYKVTATSGALSFSRRYAAIGTAAETDVEDTGTPLFSGNNLSDVGNPATAFGNIKQVATTAVSGVVQLADAAAVRAATAGRTPTADAVLSAMAFVTLADGATVNIDHAAGTNRKWTIGGNRTVAAPTSDKEGWPLNIMITQDGTGGRTVTWNAAFKFGSGGAPTLSTAAGARDLLMFMCNGNDDYIYLGMRKGI
jgi:hypothetical protein